MLDLTDEQQMIRDMVREFALGELAPGAMQVDAAARFPEETMGKLSALDLLGLAVPAEHGGAGTDTLSYAIALEELARVCGSTAVILLAHSWLAARAVALLGDEGQRERYLGPLLRGEAVGTGVLASIEPSEPASLRGLLRGDELVVNGAVPLVPAAARADSLVLCARTEDGGVAWGIVRRNTPGLVVAAAETLGLRGAGFAAVRCTDVVIPSARRLCSGDGVAVLGQMVDGARMGLGAVAVGLAQAALERGLRYAHERPQFGKPILEHGSIRELLATSAIDIETARLLVHDVCRRLEAGAPAHRQAAIAKLVAVDAAVRAADRAIQVHGGYGYVAEYHVERLYRDAMMGGVLFGPTDALRLAVANDLAREAEAGLPFLL
jgi:alkylation response protein AidB-like acyl-CoA dehydrogenase